VHDIIHTVHNTHILCACSWGWAGLGALGHDSIIDSHEPKPVRALLGLRIVQASGGGAHTLALSGEGLCKWGEEFLWVAGGG
jgi:alpha-tubulin suppressor-like RCC1 family protein